MDGIDGLAGGQAVVAGFGWVFWGWWTAEPGVMALGIFIGAGALGFLSYNWPPDAHLYGGCG